MTVSQAKIVICQHWLHAMSNIEAFLKEKFNVGLLTEEKIDYDYEVQSDEYEVQSDEFWGVRDGPNAKQTVSFPESGTPIVIPKI